MAGELEFTAILCSMLMGTTEVSHPYSVGYDLHRIRVDCETETHVIEVGLDKRSSLDSVQQALFSSYLTGKLPMVVLIDTDGRERQFELSIRTASELAGVEYRSYAADDLFRWEASGQRENPPQPGEPPS